jgi:hypothetical protein
VVDATWTPLGPDDLRTTRVSVRRAAVVVAAALLIERPA